MTQNKIVVAVTIGSVNLSNSSGTLSCFRVDRPFSRESIFSIARGINTRYRDSTGNARGGKFTTTSIPLDEGTVVMVQGRQTRNGVHHADGVIFFRARNSGPLLDILYKPPVGQHYLGERLEAFQGRGDILSCDPLYALGFQVPQRFVDTYMNEDEVEELFSSSVLSQGQLPVPEFATVATSEGLKVVAMAREPTRRLRVRR